MASHHVPNIPSTQLGSRSKGSHGFKRGLVLARLRLSLVSVTAEVFA